jgi:hypothetical protein
MNALSEQCHCSFHVAAAKDCAAERRVGGAGRWIAIWKMARQRGTPRLTRPAARCGATRRHRGKKGEVTRVAKRWIVATGDVWNYHYIPLPSLKAPSNSIKMISVHLRANMVTTGQFVTTFPPICH